MAREQREAVRTLFVFAGGVLVSVMASAILEHLFTRGSDDLIPQLFAPSPPDPRTGFYEHLYHFASVTVFVVNPLVGAIVGIFVGLLQRTWAKTVAACCLIPDFVFGSLGDTRRVWAHSARGISIYAFDHALPFATAVITAGLLRYALALRRARIQGSAQT